MKASISLNSDKIFPFVVWCVKLFRFLILLFARKDRALTAHNSMAWRDLSKATYANILPACLMLKTLEYVCPSLEGKTKARDLQAVAIWLREFASAMAVPSIIQCISTPTGILKFTQSEASSPELLSLDPYNTKSQAEGVCLSRAGCFSDGTR